MAQVAMVARKLLYRNDERREYKPGERFMARDEREAEILVRRQRAVMVPTARPERAKRQTEPQAAPIPPPIPMSPEPQPEPVAAVVGTQAAAPLVGDVAPAPDSPPAAPRRGRPPKIRFEDD